MNGPTHENRHQFAGQRVVMLLENNAYPQDIRVRQEALSLSAAGYSVTVICPSRPGQSARESIDGVFVYRYPAPRTGTGFLAYLWEYGYSLLATFVISLLICVRPGFDVIHAANPPDLAVLIAGFYKLFGKRFVYDQHDLVPEMYLARFGEKSNSPVQRVLIYLEQLSLRLADHVIATNESYKQIEMQRGRLPEHRITVVRNGPDLRDFSSAPDCQSPVHAGKTTLVYVGIIGFQDGVDYLIRALQHLVRDLRRTDFCCLIVGDGDALPNVRSLAENLGLSPYLTFTGWAEISQVRAYLNLADICVTPDPSNTYNDCSTMVKIMEYMALRKPIVAFDLPEHRVSAGSAAAYARSNDELDFARKIAALMDDPELRRKMGQIGQERVERELAWHYQAEHLLAAYARLEAG